MKDNYGTRLLSNKGLDLLRIAKIRYPKYDFKQWLFHEVPDHFWEPRQNRLDYLSWLEKKLRIKNPSQWYRYSGNIFVANHGCTLSGIYGNNHCLLLMDLRPDYEWLPWLFTSSPQGSWESRENRLRYMNWLGDRMGITKPEDWYRVSGMDFHRNRGAYLIRSVYGEDSIEAIRDSFPEYDLKPWLFPIFPIKHWKDPQIRRDYMTWLGQKLGYRKKADWYQINTIDFDENRGNPLLYGIYGGYVINALREFRPHWKWDETKLVRTRRKAIKT